MSKIVARTQKVKTGNLIGIGNHNQRKFENHSNEDIDPKKKNLNYDLVQGRTENFKTDIEKFIEENKSTKRATRKDAVLVNEWLISSDQEFFKGLSADKTREFFETSKDYFSEKFGDQNIRYAIVHLDETTPHMHMGIVPFDKDNKLSAKRMFNKTALKEIQAELPEYLESKGFDIERGEKDSERKNLSVPEYKKAMQEKELIQKETEALQKDKNALETKIEPLERRLESTQERLDSNYEALDKQIDSWEKQKKWQKNFSGASSLGQTMQEVKRYKAYVPRKNALGVTVPQAEPKLVSIKKEDYENYDVQLTRAHQARLIAERRAEEERAEKEEALKDRDKWLRERNSVVDDHNYYLNKSEELEEKNDELKKENSALKVKVDRIEEIFIRAHLFVDERLPDFGNNQYKKNFHEFLDKSEKWIEEREEPKRQIYRNRGIDR